MKKSMEFVRILFLPNNTVIDIRYQNVYDEYDEADSSISDICAGFRQGVKK